MPQVAAFTIPFTAGDGAGVLQPGTPNPEGVDVYITRALLQITTPSGAASTLDIGVDADANTLDDRLFDGQSGASATVLDNLINGGSNGLQGLLWGKDEFVTIAEASGDVTGIVGTLYLQYVRLDA